VLTEELFQFQLHAAQTINVSTNQPRSSLSFALVDKPYLAMKIITFLRTACEPVSSAGKNEAAKRELYTCFVGYGPADGRYHRKETDSVLVFVLRRAYIGRH
jgi:hypothetical protein